MDEDGSLTSPPRAGLGAVGAIFGVLALVGTAMAVTLAWRNQIDTVTTSQAMADLQTRWTLAQRDLEATTTELEATTAELDGLRDAQNADAAEDRKTEAELTALRDQVAELKQELAALQRQLATRLEGPTSPLGEASDDVDDGSDLPMVPPPESPRATLQPRPDRSEPTVRDDAPTTAVLVPRSRDDAPSAWLLPAPGVGGPPAATLAPPAQPQ